MCGLVGVISNIVLDQDDDNFIKNGLSLLRHRGPDAQKTWLSNNKKIKFGHTRLSIIDLSKKNDQPFIDKKNKLSLVYNGEIYNFLEIRKELIQAGCKFKSLGDTEVVLKGYLRWGVKFLSRLEGMFAFVLLDEKKNLALICRDKAGQKPLYYSYNKKKFQFSSELSIFLNRENTLDRYSLNEYLTYGFAKNSNTLVSNVNKVEAGTYLTLCLKKFTLRKKSFWKPIKKRFNKQKISEKDLFKKFENLFSDSIQLHLRADVPTGVLLSGGLDSSLVTSFASRFNKKIKTFSASFPDSKKLDEKEHAILISKKFKTKHTILKIENITPQSIYDILKKIDEPIIDSSIIPTYLLCKEVKNHCTVALGGDGADELFGGYDYFRYFKIIDSFKNVSPNFFNQNISKLIISKLTIGFKGRSYLNYLHDNNFNEIPLHFDNFSRKKIFKNPNNYSDIVFSKSQTHLSKENLTLNSFKNYLPNDILHKIDRASMLNSLELRSPFLNSKIIDFAFNELPNNKKFNFTNNKIFLKKFATHFLPKEFIFNRKQGFSLPLKIYMKNSRWVSFFKDILFKQNSIFCPKILDKIFIAQKNGFDNSEKIFGLIALEIWLENNAKFLKKSH